MIFLQLLINSLIAGSIYALIASGFSLIYSTNRFMHFAHGAVVVVSAYIFWAINLKTSLPLVTAAILTILFASLLGSFLFKGVYGPLQRKKSKMAPWTNHATPGSFIITHDTITIEGIQNLNFREKVQLMNCFWNCTSHPFEGIDGTDTKKGKGVDI